MKRTYYKLNETLIERLIEEFEAILKLRFIHKGAIRSVCKKVGISHTTFYRWLREYRLLVAQGKQRHRGKEKTLVDFGRAIERIFSKARSVEEKDLAFSDLLAIHKILYAGSEDLLKKRVMPSEDMQTPSSDKSEALVSFMNTSNTKQDGVYNPVFKRQEVGFFEDAMDAREKTSNEDDIDWESLTDQVTGGIGFVEFQDENTRKDV